MVNNILLFLLFLLLLLFVNTHQSNIRPSRHNHNDINIHKKNINNNNNNNNNNNWSKLCGNKNEKKCGVTKNDVIKHVMSAFTNSNIQLKDEASFLQSLSKFNSIHNHNNEMNMIEIEDEYNFYSTYKHCATTALLQGMCSSCVVYSMTTMLGDRLCRKYNKLTQLSTSHVLNCLSNDKSEQELCSGGGFTPFTVAKVLHKGVSERPCFSNHDIKYQCALLEAMAPFLHDVPSDMLIIANDLKCYQEWKKTGKVNRYESIGKPKCKKCDQGKVHHLQNIYQFLLPIDASNNLKQKQQQIHHNVELIQREIKSKGPVMSIISSTPISLMSFDGHGVYVPPVDDSSNNNNNNNNNAEDESTSVVDLFTNTAHAIKIIGWDKEAWLIQNSWGKHWANKGVFRLKKGINALGIESSAFGVTVSSSNEESHVWYDEANQLKLAYGLINSASQKLQSFIKISDTIKQLHQEVKLLSDALYNSGDDKLKVTLGDKVIEHLNLVASSKPAAKRFQFMALTLGSLMKELYDYSILQNALLPHITHLNTLSKANNNERDLNAAECNALYAFLSQTRTASIMILEQDHNVDYAPHKDSMILFMRMLTFHMPKNTIKDPLKLKHFFKQYNNANKIRYFISHLINLHTENDH